MCIHLNKQLYHHLILPRFSSGQREFHRSRCRCIDRPSEAEPNETSAQPAAIRTEPLMNRHK